MNDKDPLPVNCAGIQHWIGWPTYLNRISQWRTRRKWQGLTNNWWGKAQERRRVCGSEGILGVILVGGGHPQSGQSLPSPVPHHLSWSCPDITQHGRWDVEEIQGRLSPIPQEVGLHHVLLNFLDQNHSQRYPRSRPESKHLMASLFLK